MNYKLSTFDMILKSFGTNLKEVYLNATGYVNGIYECLNIVKQETEPGDKITDIGCGSGFLSWILKDEMRVFSTEISGADGELDIFKKVDQEKLYKALGLRYKKASIQLEGHVMLHAVYEHMDFRKKRLRDISELMETGKKLFIFRCPQEKSYSEAITKSHSVLLSVETLISEITEAGFNIDCINYTDFLIWSVPFLQPIYNWLFPIFNFIDKAMLKTPLKKFAHNITVIATKR